MPGKKQSRKSRRSPRFGDSVFINCPFDREYWPIFEAAVFCVVHCGFVPRSTLEFTDSGEVRLHRLRDLIRSCKYAIHDLSRVELSPASGMPRFNMPFELGLDLGARYYGAGKLERKRCLVLIAHDYAHQKALSDISGQDPRNHHNSPDEAMHAVRDWLQGASGRVTIAGPARITARFRAFSEVIPGLATRAGLDRHRLTFIDYVHLAEEWLRGTGS
ncbi:MAG TPA: hypothetical protein VFU23_10005 [Gemmatimonadales bacterium]|nr:hypothetical protein [Gemmatimonadales bacterium]